MISALVLKIIACIDMFIDHFAVALYGQKLISYMLYDILLSVGRIAFPIFCFLIVEGAKHTKNRLFYVCRLLFLALISEVPFDMLFYKSFWQPGTLNVMFTLLFGLLPVWILPWAVSLRKWKRVGGIALYVVALAGLSLIAEILFFDYGAGGVITIATMGLLNLPLTKLREDVMDERVVRLFFAIPAILILILLCGNQEIWAWFALIPILLYNGRKGTSSKVVQYSFYLFYPLHLLVLALIFTLPLIIRR